jgi:DNA ligase (NAD+)
MLSFNDAFSKEDMEDWLERISKLLTPAEKEKIDFFCELKIDGLAIELIYEKGILKTGSTRGDGILGENVTQNLKTIEAIPLRLREKEDLAKDLKEIDLNKLQAAVIARGEVFISKKEFEKLNREQEKEGLKKYANPRNVAAGSIRQLDPKITAQRRLDSYAYDLITDLGQTPEGKPPRRRTSSLRGRSASFGARTHQEEHEILKTSGFKTNPHNKYCKNLAEVFDFHKSWQEKREKLPYEIDGIVVIVNSNKIFEKLGVVGKAPRGAIAFKFALKQATTIVEDIKIQVGRTGALTPVAYLKPVQVGGVTISRATLHNEDEIKRLDVKIGDTVIVGRAGDVIPDIVKVLPELRTGKEKAFKMPKFCPICGSKVMKPEGEVLARCLNPRCFAKQRRYFHHFISKGAFNVIGLGPKIIDRLIDAGLISDPADLFKLEVGDIIPLESLPRRKPKAFLRGFAEKSAQNLIGAIQSRKKITLAKFIYALGIRNVGEETALDLAEIFGSLEKIKKASLEDLQGIRDVGPIVAKSIYDWFQQKRNIEFLEKLRKFGVEIESLKIKAKGLKLKRLIFVLTGSLETMTRDEAKERIRGLGGEISESVSKKTDYVIVGKEPGSKFNIAKKLKVKTIEEREFLNMLH